jgi:23S rRNA-/tRNA-specific pseudouridylate synthase
VCLPKDIEISQTSKEEDNDITKLDPKQVKQLAARLKEMIIFENDHLIVVNKDNGVPS